jgi:hypothetical protein
MLFLQVKGTLVLLWKLLKFDYTTVNFNRNSGFMLSQAWYPLINLFQKSRRLERDEDGLSNTATNQKLETDLPGEGLG